MAGLKARMYVILLLVVITKRLSDIHLNGIL